MIAGHPLTDRFTAAPQIDPDDLPALKAQGYALVINNRPDAEVPPSHRSQPFATAAAAAGLSYRYIPVAGGFGPDLVSTMAEALASAGGPVFAWCRSGNRSTHLWALAQASAGADPAALVAAAAACGYDLRPMADLLANLSNSANPAS